MARGNQMGRVNTAQSLAQAAPKFMTSTAFGAVMALSVALMPMALQAQSYQFSNVQVEGNQRVQTATIVSYTGLSRGDVVSAGDLNDAYRGVFDTGLFESVELIPRGNTLVIKVTEYPTVSRISFEGNRRIKDDTLQQVVESAPRRVFSAQQAEADAAAIAALYKSKGRLASKITPRIIRRSDNRVDLVFEIAEGDTVEVERVSFVGNRAYSDRRLRRVMETKQANLLRSVINRDTLIEDRIQFDRQVLSDFYQSRGYVDFRINSVNAEVTEEQDAVFLVVDMTEGQQYEFGEITVTSEIAEADPDLYVEALRVKPGVTYSPTIVDNSVDALEQMAVRAGVDFLRVEPRVTRNDRDLTLDVEFAMVRGERIFVERIDIEGNTTTLDRVVRRQFKLVEGDPLNPREIRNSAERIRALGFFSESDVDVREGSTPSEVIVDVDVIEQPTGSFSFGGSYSVDDGFGVAVGLTERNFLGRGQQLSLNVSTSGEAKAYQLGFIEPNLLGRELTFGIDLGLTETDSSYAEYDTSNVNFKPYIGFDLSETTAMQLRYGLSSDEMISRGSDSDGDPLAGPVFRNEIGEGKRTTSSLGFTLTYDSKRTGLNPTSRVLIESGIDYAGLGGDNEYIRLKNKIVAQKLVFNEEVTLRATFESGVLGWMGNNSSRTVDRFVLSSSVMRGFEPGGIGPRDMSTKSGTTTYDDALGGNMYAVARFDAEFPLGLPEELGMRGGVFYDVGNLWGLDNADLSGAGNVVGRDGSFRHAIGVSLLWTTAFGPLRLNFSRALVKEDYDKERNFDLTVQARF